MEWRLLVGSIIALGVAAAHSVIGERRILIPLLKMSFDFCPPQRQAFFRLTLRFAWHLTSILLLGCAALLLALSLSPVDLTSILVLEVLGALFVAVAAITGCYSRGRHVAWPLFAIVGFFCWWVAVQHKGPVSFDVTKPTIGLGASSIFLLVGAVHLFWAIRGQGNLAAVIPENNAKPLFHPSRIGTLAVAIGLAVASALVAAQSSGTVLFGMPLASKTGCWLLAVILIARSVGDFRYVGLLKTIHETPFGYYDTAVYTPLCLLLAVSVITVTF